MGTCVKDKQDKRFGRRVEIPRMSPELMEEIFKLTCYICNRLGSYQMMLERGTAEDFVQSAFLDYLEHGYQSFNPQKGKLSTHISMFINKQYTTILNQSLYNISYEEAKYVERVRSRAKASGEEDTSLLFIRVKSICSPVPVDINPANGSDDTDDSCSLLDYADLDESYELDPASIYLGSDDVIIESFQKQVDRYLARKPDWFKRDKYLMDREKDIITTYIFGARSCHDKMADKVTLQDIADKYGVTRAWIGMITKSFKIWAKNDAGFLRTFCPSEFNIADLDPDAYTKFRHEQKHGKSPDC